MKKQVLVFVLLLSGLLTVNAQSDMASLGAAGGCQDGKRAAFSNSDAAKKSIMENPSISDIYKEAYAHAFDICKDGQAAENSNKWKFSKDSDANKKRWTLYVFLGKLVKQVKGVK